MHTARISTPHTNTANGNSIEESLSELEAMNASSCKEYIVKPAQRSEIREFIEKWHYSHNINGLMSNYCFAMYYKDTMIGAMIYGHMAMANQWRKYGKSPEDVIELRRLAMIDTTLRNSESYFIGKTIKWLKKNTNIHTIVSYADTFYGHKGIIYEASNFTKVGKSSAGRVIMFNGKHYHDKTIRTTYKGKLKPFAKRVKDALDSGEAYYVKTPGKNIYVYTLIPDSMNTALANQ